MTHIFFDSKSFVDFPFPFHSGMWKLAFCLRGEGVVRCDGEMVSGAWGG